MITAAVPTPPAVKLVQAASVPQERLAIVTPIAANVKPAKSRQANTLAKKLIGSAEGFLGFKVNNIGTAAERLTTFAHRMDNSPELKPLLKSYARLLLDSTPSSNAKAGHVNHFDTVVRILISSFLQACSQSPNTNQKRQHWLPLAYLRNFPVTAGKIHQTNTDKKREAFIDCVSYQEGTLVLDKVHDEHFVHEWNEKTQDENLFYELKVESAFSIIEGLYSNAMKGDKALRRDATLAAFMAAQTVRMPYLKNGKFHKGDLTSILDAILRNLDTLDGKLYASQMPLKTVGPLGFTLASFARAYKKGDEITHMMPLSSKAMLFISNAPLPPLKRKAVLRTSMYSLYKRIRTSGEMVYGATPVTLRKVNVEKVFENL